MTHKALGNNKRGILYIISAPAGTGKTTLVEMLTKEFSCVVSSVSYTTRKPRGKEKNGIEYIFIDKDEFDQKIATGDFLEYVTLYDQNYGTSREWVEKQLHAGHHVVLVIDTQGALKLKGKTDSVSIFIRPPSLEELKKRLTERKTESAEHINRRLDWAKHELEHCHEYDYLIVNDNLRIAYDVLRSIFIAEEHKNNKIT